MEEIFLYIEIAIKLSLTVGPLVLGFWLGRRAEKRHYQSIRKRETRWLHVPTLTQKAVPEGYQVVDAQMVVGSVVVSIDYFKRTLASLRKFFGGEIGAYSSLIDRGRREAMLRMKESQPNASMFVNCRLHTATLYSGKGKRVHSVEVYAYATAVQFQ